MHILEAKKEKRRKTSEAFFRAIFPRVKICKFSFSYYKNQKKSGRLRHFANVHFFGRCTFVMCILGTGCLMYWSEVVRSVPGATSKARREKRRFTKVSKQSLDLVQC